MANFVEKATLLVDDRSSKGINKINKALRQMRKDAMATQKALKGIAFPSGAGSYDKKLRATASALNAFSRAAGKVPKRVSINVQMRGTSAAQIRSMSKALGQYKSTSRNINSLVGNRAMNFSNLDRLVDKLARVARAASMASTKLANVRNNASNIPGGAGGGDGRGSRNSGMLELNLKPFEIMWRSALFQLSHTIVNSIQQGFAKGAKGFDVAVNKIRQQRLDESTKQVFTNTAFERSKVNPLVRADQRMDFYAEVSPNFANPTEALKLDNRVDMAIKAAVQAGQSAEEAFKGVATLFRGLGSAGLLADNDGNLDPKVLNYLDAYISAKVSEGAQINWEEAFQQLKYARTSAQTMTPRQFFMELISAADVGASTAGVQLNMFTKNFAGESTKKAVAAQEKGGLREEGEMIKSGAVGKKTSYTYQPGRVIDEDLFRTNPREWIKKYIMGPGGFLEKAGVDLTKASKTDVITALDPLSSNRNADDYLSRVVLQFMEYELKANKFLNKPFTNEEFDAISQTSSYVKLQEATQKVIEALGLLADKLEGPILTVLGFIERQAQNAVDLLRGTSSDKLQSALGASAIAGGAVGIGTLLTQFATIPFAIRANTNALNRNTAALLGQGAGGGPGGGGRGRGGAWMGLLGLLGRGGAVGAGAFIPSSTNNTPYADLDASGRKRARMDAAGFAMAGNLAPQMQEASQKLSEATIKLAKVQEELAFGKSAGYNPSGDYMMDRRLKAEELQSTIDGLQNSLNSSALQIQAAFDGGATKLADSADGMGQQLAESLLGTASTWGSQAAAALMGQLGSLNLNVNGSSDGPNTGTNTNLATGG